MTRLEGITMVTRSRTVDPCAVIWLLRDGRLRLTGFLVGSQTLGESLRQVADLTIEALPQTDHAGITLLVADARDVGVHPSGGAG